MSSNQPSPESKQLFERFAIVIGIGVACMTFFYMGESYAEGQKTQHPALPGMDQVMKTDKCTVYSAHDGKATVYVAQNDDGGIPCAVSVTSAI